VLTQYNVLVFFHVASVIVWLGVGTTVALIAVYAQRARDPVMLDRLAGFVSWLGLRVFAPASLGAFGFGIAAAHSGHWPRLFWFHVGEAAFAISFLLNVAVRLPLVRRTRHGAIHPLRVARLVLALALAELTVLYLAVADMVVKPSSSDTNTLTTGGVILALAVLAAAVTALRSSPPRDELPASLVPRENESKRAA
jgi:hypothetical protein